MPLTDEQKLEVLRHKDEGYGYLKIGNALGLSRDQVRDYCRTKGAKQKAEELRLDIKPRSKNKNIKKPKHCKFCGEEHNRHNRTYCSDECKKRMSEQRKEETKLSRVRRCVKCNKEFMPNSGTQVYCSKSCRTVTRTCKFCGEQYQRVNKSQSQQQKYCSRACAGKDSSMTHEEYYKVFYNKHKGFLVPLELYVKGDKELKVLCLKCNKTSVRRADRFVRADRHSGCRHCVGVTSAGEKAIELWLNNNGLNYESEYSFDDLVNEQPLRFDFAVLGKDMEVRLLIEYDGRQHFEPVKRFGGIKFLKEQQSRDNMKKDYAMRNNIPLLRIKYTDKNKINDILYKHVKI